MNRVILSEKLKCVKLFNVKLTHSVLSILLLCFCWHIQAKAFQHCWHVTTLFRSFPFEISDPRAHSSDLRFQGLGVRALLLGPWCQGLGHCCQGPLIIHKSHMTPSICNLNVGWIKVFYLIDVYICVYWTPPAHIMAVDCCDIVGTFGIFSWAAVKDFLSH